MDQSFREWNAQGAARTAGILATIFGGMLVLWGAAALLIVMRPTGGALAAATVVVQMLIVTLGLTFVALGLFAHRRVAWAQWVLFFGGAGLAAGALGTMMSTTVAPSLAYVFALATLTSVTAWIAIITALRQRRAQLLARIISEGDRGAPRPQ